MSETSESLMILVGTQNDVRLFLFEYSIRTNLFTLHQSVLIYNAKTYPPHTGRLMQPEKSRYPFHGMGLIRIIGIFGYKGNNHKLGAKQTTTSLKGANISRGTSLCALSQLLFLN